MRKTPRIILWVCAVAGGITLCLAIALGAVFFWYWPRVPEAPVGTAESPSWGSLSAEIAEARRRGEVPPPFVADAVRGPAADGNLRVLVMSAGGQYGAFGAGVLEGWSESGYRPYFDVVTGLSVGSILAPIAFLGHEHDAKLTSLIQELAHAVDRHPIKKMGPVDLLGALWGRGFPVSVAIESVLRSYFDEPLLDLIAEEHKNGRRLYVGSTDLTAGRVVIWDLGAIASSGRSDRATRFQDAIFASISVPIAMPATYIETGEAGTYALHVDGSFLAPIFVTTLIGSYAGLTKNFTIDVVVNNRLKRPQPLEQVSPQLVDLIPRLFYLVHSSQFERSMDLLLARAKVHGFTVRVLAIPEKQKLPFSLNFSGTEILNLYKIGKKAGRKSDSWISLPEEGLPAYWSPQGAQSDEAERSGNK